MQKFYKGFLKRLLKEAVLNHSIAVAAAVGDGDAGNILIVHAQVG